VKSLALWLLPALLAPGCTCRGSSSAPGTTPVSAPQPAPAETDGGGAPAHPVVLDLIHDIDSCSLGHRGVLLDFGDLSMKDDLHPGSIAHGDDELVEHEGATWLRARSRTVTASFTWPAFANETPDSSVYVEVRLRGVTARAVTLSIDGKPVGTETLVRSSPRVVLARPPAPLTLAPGSHELTMRFVGGPRTAEEPLAEIDWAHVGTGDTTEPYAAPTRADVVVDAAVGGRSLRALSLRAPGFVRCATWMPANATVEASLATVGGGDADVEARLVRDRHAPVVLGAAHVAGGGVTWAPWSVPVTGLEGDGALASLEIVVKRATKGTRVLLGEPRALVAESSPLPPAPTARSVLLVVLGSTAAKSLAPWGGPHPAPELTRLASAGTTFTANRASSSLAASVIATILTGLPARVHGVDDPDARLPHGPTTLEEACKQGGLVTAAFTANPTTGAVFGFDRGWDTFTAHDPLENVPGTTVFDDAAAWIDAHKTDRFLVVLHARGGHPPWDATPDQLKTMPPDNYLGIVEPQRAAEALTKARKHAGRFKEDDRARAWALYDHALDAHDDALGKLLAALRAAGREDDTLVIVTGDVAPTEGPPVPFVDVDTLDEPLLATPLVIRWPGAGTLAGRRVDAPSTPLDLARTVAGALGLSPVPQSFQGEDLALVARGALVPSTRPLAATREGRFAVRWGQFVLVGHHDHELRMCDLSLDIACVADVRATTPLALEPIHRWAIDALAPISPPPFPREPAVLDDHTTAALVRWGRPSDDRDLKDDH
jgi:arylsulfatase A-like enzyme